MKVGTFVIGTSERRLGLLYKNGVLDLTAVMDAAPKDMRSFIALGDQALTLVGQIIRRLEGQGGPEWLGAPVWYSMDKVTWTVPLVPPKIIGIGHNYADLLHDVGKELPTVPTLFAKWNTTLTPPGGTVALPTEWHEVSYEVELAVVIGRVARNVSVAEALDSVFGYTIADDVTAIDCVREDVQLTRSKNYDTFTPLGPWIVHRSEIPDPQRLGLKLWQNGKLRQDSSTGQMVFGVAELVAFVSGVCTLEPGDVILTGSPTGVARLHNPPAHLRAGDQIEAEIEGIGCLRHSVA